METHPTARPSELQALLTLRCPRCRIGKIFRGPTAMNERCPECGLKFEREYGYFTGAMYVSYALGIPTILVGVLIGKLLLPSWPVHWVLLLSWLVFLPLVPLVFRYSRGLWMHFDRAIDREPES